MEAIIPENAGMTKRVSIRQIRLSFWKALKLCVEYNIMGLLWFNMICHKAVVFMGGSHER